jgi:hypothetical protein
MEMIKSRNLTSHTYNPEVADEIALAIRTRYHGVFNRLVEKLDPLTTEREE